MDPIAWYKKQSDGKRVLIILGVILAEMIFSFAMHCYTHS